MAMVKRSVLGGGLVLAVGVGAVVACSNYVPPDVPSYGPPNGLSGKTPPAPTASEPTDSGAVATGDSGGTGGGPSFLCTTAGGTIVDGGPCAVSFTNDIYPQMQAGGRLNCAQVVGCHGGTLQPSFAAPVAQTAAGFYGVLANYTLVDDNNVAYVNPCSTDPTKSGFACNTVPSGGTGACGLSMPSGAPLATADQQMIATWVACGAPDN